MTRMSSRRSRTTRSSPRTGSCPPNLRSSWAARTGASSSPSHLRSRTSKPRSLRCSESRVRLGRAAALKRVVRRGLTGLVHDRSRRHLDRAVQQRVIGLLHPSLELVPELGEDLAVGGILGEVAGFGGIERQVIELLGSDDLVRPPSLDQRLLARAVVAVGKHRMLVVVEAAYVLPSLGSDGPGRLVGGVEGDLGEDLVVNPLGLSADQWEQ